MKNIKVFNAIYIRYRVLMESIAVKLCMTLLVLASTIFSFFPFLNSLFVDDSLVQVKTIGFELVNKNKEMEIVDKNEDISVEYDNGSYIITVVTDKGHSDVGIVSEILYQLNVSQCISHVDEKDVSLLTGSNIKIVDETPEMLISTDKYIFFMAVVLMFFLMVLILISRIAAKIASEKGNQFTEVILTSMTCRQLYIAEIVADFLVVISNIAIVMLPMLVAAIIENPRYTSDFDFLNIGRCSIIIVHLILGIFSIIVLCVGITSLSKEQEDANAYATIFMIPLMVSYLYTVFKFELFDGVWSFLNYIPFFSIFPVLSSLISNVEEIANLKYIFICDFLFIVIELLVCEKIFCRNISKK